MKAVCFGAEVQSSGPSSSPVPKRARSLSTCSILCLISEVSEHQQAANMKSIYFVAGLFVMLVQGSWQCSLQDTEEKSSLYPAPHADSLNNLHQINEEKRYAEGTFISDYSKVLEALNDHKFMDSLLDQLKNGIAKRHDEFKRHSEGSFNSDLSSHFDKKATKEFIAWLVKGLERQHSPKAIPEARHRRHAEGSFTDEMITVLDKLVTQDFIKWLLQNKIIERK